MGRSTAIFKGPAPGENFTRIETFGNNASTGNNDVHWIKAFVNPATRGVFSREPMVVPANRVERPGARQKPAQ